MALVAISAVSIFLAYTSLQSTEVRLDLTAVQEARRVLVDDTNHAVEDLGRNLDTISRRLQIAASSYALSERDDSEEARALLDMINVGLERYTQSIDYVDNKGTLLLTTERELLDPTGSDRSDGLYYVQARERRQPVVTEVFQATDGKASVSIAVPIFTSEGNFEGVVAAIIPTEYIVEAVEDHLSFTENNVFLIATDGTIIGHADGSMIGMSIFDQFDGRNDVVNRNLQNMIEGRSGVFEYTSPEGQRRVAVYSPVGFSGIHTWSVFITTSPPQSQAFSTVLNDQRVFTIVAIILIGMIAAIFITFILTLNSRLHVIVQKQEQQIRGQLDDLRDTYERLTEQDKMKDEFINIAAHELRTPVLPIILSAEGLAEEIGSNNSKIEIILRNARRINKLTNDILDVSRIKSNTFRLQKEQVSLKKIIEESIQDVIFKMAENKSHNLKIAIDSKLPEGKDEISADRGRLNQVFANLLDNAVNFTDQGTITVSLQQGTDPGFTEVRVTDTGKGIDPAIRPRLFEKFATKSEKAKGTGLGLYLCKAIVEAHGGRIWAEDNIGAGKGAVFAFSLPTQG
ncbi:MAG: sensor histidine kinase [Nitrososphaera sp.]